MSRRSNDFDCLAALPQQPADVVVQGYRLRRIEAMLPIGFAGALKTLWRPWPGALAAAHPAPAILHC